MGRGPYRHVRILVVGWELRHVWDALRRLDVEGLSLARRESFLEALEWRPKVIVYNSDQGQPPIVGGMIGDAPPAFVAVGGDTLLAGLAEGADAVFHLPENVRDRHTRDEKARHQRRQVLKTMARLLRRGIYRVRAPCRARPDGGLQLHIQGVLSMGAPVAMAGGLDLQIPPPDMLGRCAPGPTSGRQISEILASGQEVDGQITHPMPEVADYLSRFPLDHLAAARRMPQRALQALQLLGAEPRALDLAQSNPVLFWMLIDAMQRRLKLPEAASLALEKQTRLLGVLLEGSCPQRKVKLCKRFEVPTPLQPRHLEIMRQTLRSEPLTLGFRHWQRIPLSLLEMQDEHLPHSTWLRKAAAQGHPPPAHRVQPLLRDTLRLAEELGHLPAHALQCRTREELVTLHDRYVAARNQQREALYKKRFVRPERFPPPPLAGTKHIQPILNSFDLDQEGAEMHHCVGTYAKQLQTGSHAFYRVLSPERATLQIHRTPKNTWRIQQLAGHCNAPVRPQTQKAVLDWLEKEQPTKHREAMEPFNYWPEDDIPF